MKQRHVVGLIIVMIIGLLSVVLYLMILPSKQENSALSTGDSTHHESRKERPYYTCPMHPSIHKDSPGVCPICGMTLVKKIEDVDLASPKAEPVHAVTLSPSKQMLANVATAVAKRGVLAREIRTAGSIAYPEPNYRRISMRFAGRIEKLYLTYTGQDVREGDPVADVYSPDAVSAQQEYLLAKSSFDQVKGAHDIVSGSARMLLEQSKHKLLLWGFMGKQIDQLEESKTAKDTITIYSPVGGTVLKKFVDPQQYVAAGEILYDVADLSTVWVNADVYEYEASGLKIGERVEVVAEAYPNELFPGTLQFISPTVESSSRTVRVRGEFANMHRKLKPDMYVSVVLKAMLSPAITVPTSAVLSTGFRQVVWVQKAAGTFEPRLVKVGQRSNEYIQILAGLNEGDTVVTSGGYLLDSESQLQAAHTP